jgi:hypothetical protein
MLTFPTSPHILWCAWFVADVLGGLHRLSDVDAERQLGTLRAAGNTAFYKAIQVRPTASCKGHSGAPHAYKGRGGL